MRQNLPILHRLIGGILLYNDPLEEDPDKYYAPMDNEIIGYANQAVNTTNDFKRGSGNLFEQGATEDNKGYKFVFDFNTAQGNGKISAIGLTSSLSGQIGKGSEFSTDMPLYLLTSYGYDMGGDNTVNHQINAHMQADLVALKNDYGYIVQQSAANTINIKVINLNFSEVSLYTQPTTPIMNNPVVKEANLTTTIFGSTYSTSNLYQTYISDNNGYVWGFQHNNNANGNSSGNATINWIKIDLNDLSFIEGTWTIEAQIYSFGKKTYINNNFNKESCNVSTATIFNNYLYCLQYQGKGIYKINLNDPADILYIPHPTSTIPTSITASKPYQYCYSILNTFGNTIFLPNGHLEKDVIIPHSAPLVIDSAYSGCPQQPYGIRDCSKANVQAKQFLMCNTFRGWNSGNGTIRGYVGFYIPTFYLATINNLEVPIEKTNDKTMKITYILTEVEGEE